MVRDIGDTENLDRIGGGNPFTTATIRNLVPEASVNSIIKCDPNDVFVRDFRKRGIQVHVIPAPGMTRFKNIRNPQNPDKRTQYVYDIQNPISPEDLDQVQSEIVDGAIILVTPVFGEVPPKSIAKLKERGKFVALMPQGNWRHRLKDGRVIQVPWLGFEEALRFVDVVIFSREDITIDGVFDEALFNNIVELSPLTILTQGHEGATIYKKGDKPLQVKAFKLTPEEEAEGDFVGAGDVFAATWVVEFMRTGDIRLAVKLANLLAASKILRVGGGNGLDSIPNNKQYAQFKIQYKKRIEEFHRLNHYVS